VSELGGGYVEGIAGGIRVGVWMRVGAGEGGHDIGFDRFVRR
jgi:hypothetical protein